MLCLHTKNASQACFIHIILQTRTQNEKEIRTYTSLHDIIKQIHEIHTFGHMKALRI